jgi:uncharacterized protein involved in exopolysaccharide biosynthesis
MTLLGAATILLKRRRIAAGVPLAAVLAALAISFLVPKTFTATTTFIAQSAPRAQLPAGLSAIAGQLGVSLGSDGARSPRFYAQLATSRELMERVLLAHYADPRTTASVSDSVSLLALLNVEGHNLRDSLDDGIKSLRRRLAVRPDLQTGMVHLRVDAHWPELAAAVATRFIENLNEFNAKTLQSQARERRRFVEGRLADAERELRGAEEQLRTFYERNRSWQQAPQLMFEEGRLRRQVEIQQDVYLTLRREYEAARIEEVNDTPLITVIDTASAPAEPSSPKRGVLVLVALLLGTVGGGAWALTAERLQDRRRADDPEYAELRSVWQEMRRALSRTTSRVGPGPKP